MGQPKKVPAGEFKQTCLGLMEQVRRSGRPVMVTKRGEPLVLISRVEPAKNPPRRLGLMQGTGKILGDIVAPVADLEDWNVHKK